MVKAIKFNSQGVQIGEVELRMSILTWTSTPQSAAP
jgi:hypothetical protein